MFLIFIAQFALNIGNIGIGPNNAVVSVALTIPYLVLGAQIFVIAYVILKLLEKRNSFAAKVLERIENASVELALMVAATAMLSSLFYSQILNLVPCELCWFQRIFIYPLFFIIAVGIFRKDRGVFWYVLPLNIIAIIFSVYQYILQVTNLLASACESTCAQKMLEYFGYMTIPMMALTASVTVAILLYAHYKTK